MKLYPQNSEEQQFNDIPTYTRLNPGTGEQDGRSRIQEANPESWGNREPFFNSTSRQILIGLVVSSRKEDLCLRLLIWGQEGKGGGADTGHILGVLWEKVFANLSKGKMLLIFPSVLQKVT